MKSRYSVIILIMLCEVLWEGIHCQIEENLSGKQKSKTLTDFLNAAGSVLHTAKEYINITSQNTEPSPLKPMDCAEILERNSSVKSGIYKIWPRSRILKGPITVYCDMDDDGGAWTVIQRRGNFDSPKDYFFRDWASYKVGFGDVLKDFWLGNDNIFALTNERACNIKFTLSDWNGTATYATYDEFWIDDEAHKYVMHVTGYRGTSGDSFTFTNGHPFTTKDKDNDQDGANCAVTFSGAWWYVACHESNLNGLYLKGQHESYANGVEWSAFKGQHYSLKDTVMKIRPRDFNRPIKSEMTPM